jgi:hypothetical protein
VRLADRGHGPATEFRLGMAGPGFKFGRRRSTDMAAGVQVGFELLDVFDALQPSFERKVIQKP